MDFNERMEQLRQEYEKRRAEMEERLKQQRSILNDSLLKDYMQTVRANTNSDDKRPDIRTDSREDGRLGDKTIRPLEHLNGLEDDSETKVGNFESLISNYFTTSDGAQEQFASFGYDDVDMSPMVSLLASVVEIEFKVLLADYIDVWGLKGEGTKATLGSLSNVYNHNKGCRFLKNIFASARVAVDISESQKQFDTITRKRNCASHGEIITPQNFIQFYNRTFYPFYHGTLKAIVEYKAASVDKCGDARLAGSQPSDRLSEQPFMDNGRRPVARQYDNRYTGDSGGKCVIFTNLDILALKYCSDVNQVVDIDGRKMISSVPLAIIREIIEPFCLQAAQYGMEYKLLNVSDSAYDRLVDSERSWDSHLAVLDSFCQHEGIGSDTPVSLFILGGDDVIPMPKVKNPIVTPEIAAEKLQMLESTLEADWLYSFPSRCVSITKDGYLEWEPLSGIRPRFHVSRLPMENGLMETSLKQDLQSYFERANGERDGIDIRNFTMVACDSAKRVANKIAEGLPVSPIPYNVDSEYYYGKAFISPKLNIEQDNDSRDEYLRHLKHSDMLAFILHGSHHPNMPFYVGQDLNEHTNQPPAFSPEYFSWSPAKVIASICCWGARFINYRREKSALLSAIYSNGLIFFGSCRPAWGAFDFCFSDGVPAEISLAEKLQRLFMLFLLAGYPSGEALSMAKCVYVNRIPENDKHKALHQLTLLEFNLFGDPMLRLKPSISLPDDIFGSSESDNVYMLPNFSTGAFSTKISVVANYENSDILSRVRSLVDSNLNNIRYRLNELLPQKYRIDPTTLRRVERWSAASNGESYCFCYKDRETEEMTTYVFTDTDGKITQIFGTI